MKINF